MIFLPYLKIVKKKEELLLLVRLSYHFHFVDKRYLFCYKRKEFLFCNKDFHLDFFRREPWLDYMNTRGNNCSRQQRCQFLKERWRRLPRKYGR